MNKQIKLLAELAKFAIDVSNDPNSPPSWWAAGHNECFEKFAELIVRECIQVLKDTGYPNAHGNCVGVEELKQHFGVDLK